MGVNGERDIGGGRQVEIFDRNRFYAAMGYALTPGLRVQGALETRLRLTCSRCLEVFTLPVRCRFDVTYSAIVPGGDEVELGTRDLTVGHLEGEAVDLAEMVHEQVLLALPMAPVCAPDCKGLCPHCGANLNRGECACAARAADPRFDVGDRVRVRRMRPEVHHRCPRYVRGAIGVVERVAGDEHVPRAGPGQPDGPLEAVYTVRFDSTELWGDRREAGEPPYELLIDLWERYVEAA